MQNLILIGYMGSGKTTVGKLLSKRYGYQFVDTDEMIEKQQNCKISDIFEKDGEAYFRELETKLLKEIQKSMEHTVIATGGGMPCQNENAMLLRQLGTVVYLKVSKKIILQRVQGDTTRPLLNGNQLEKKVESMLAIRDPLYENAAHYVIETDHIPLHEVVERIHELENQ